MTITSTIPGETPQAKQAAAALILAAHRQKYGKYREFQRRYFNDPAAFIHDCVDFGEGRGPSPYQERVLQSIPTHRRVSVRGPHGLGKSALGAWSVLWFALTRDGDDWKAPTTASAWRQLTKFFWPEIHKWSRHVRWDLVGRKPFSPQIEVLNLNLKLETGEAFALTSDRPELIEGAHAEHLFYVFDEAKVIPTPTWDSAEGAFSTGNVYWLALSTPGQPSGRFYDIQARKDGYEDWLAIHVTLEEAIAANRINEEWAEQRRRQWGVESSVYKTRVLGEFSSDDEEAVIPLHLVEMAIERWQSAVSSTQPLSDPTQPLHDPAESVVNQAQPLHDPTQPTSSPTQPTSSPTQPTSSPTQPLDSPLQPMDQPLEKNAETLREFHPNDDASIGSTQVEPSRLSTEASKINDQRNMHQNEAKTSTSTKKSTGTAPGTRVKHPKRCFGEFRCVGVDVARAGSDKTVLALRHGDAISEIRSYAKAATTTTVGNVIAVLGAHPDGHAMVDVIGVGAGVYDQIHEKPKFRNRVYAFNASGKTTRRDRTREFKFLNKRAAAWWYFRELLEDGIPMLPNNDILVGDLTSPRWKVSSTGRIQVESKEDIKKRIGRSTDVADAVIQAFWEEARGAGLV